MDARQSRQGFRRGRLTAVRQFVAGQHGDRQRHRIILGQRAPGDDRLVNLGRSSFFFKRRFRLTLWADAMAGEGRALRADGGAAR